ALAIGLLDLDDLGTCVRAFFGQQLLDLLGENVGEDAGGHRTDYGDRCGQEKGVIGSCTGGGCKTDFSERAAFRHALPGAHNIIWIESQVRWKGELILHEGTLLFYLLMSRQSVCTM